MTDRISSRFFVRAAFAFLSVQGFVASAQELRINGLFSQGYIESSHYNYLADSENGDFDFTEIALNASWTPIERTTVNGQLFAFELGPYGNFEPTIDYLFVDHSFRQEFGIRLGRIKREQGIYNHIQDIDVSRTAILLPMGMYDQRYRDISASLDGASAYGSFKLGQRQSIDYTVYGGFYDLDEEGGLAGYALSEISRITIDARIDKIASDYNVGGQIWYNPALEGLRFGAALSYFPNVTASTFSMFPETFPVPRLAGQSFRSINTDIDYQNTRLSIDYFIGNWTFASEGVRGKTNQDITTLVGENVQFSGRAYRGFDTWYFSIARRFGPFETAFTYSDYLDTSTPIPGTPPRIPHSYDNRDSQLSLRYDATDYWTLKLESHSIHGTSRLFNQFGQNPSLDQKAWTLWAVKSTFYF